MGKIAPASDNKEIPSSAWNPLRQPLFRSLWIASAFSNICTWVHDVGSTWMMTSLAPSPLMIALVQTATTIPVFFFALPAGALADIVDRRRLLLVAQGWTLAAAATLGILTFFNVVTPWLLLFFTFILGMGAVFTAPAWQAIVPELVDRKELQPAIALSSASINIARAVGPALGGVLVAAAGPGAAFAFNAFSFVGTMVVLYRWRRTSRASALPAERFLGAIGGGALAGAGILSKVGKKLSPDMKVAAATVIFAAVTTVLALSSGFAILCTAMFAGGVAWIAVVSSFNVAAQTAVSHWVRARAMATYLLVFQGGMAIGALLWGTLATHAGTATTLLCAASGLILGLVAKRWFRITTGAGIDLMPSMHWPTPLGHETPEQGQGPVMIMVEYRIDPADADAFVPALQALGHIRRRDGAVQ